MFKIEKEKYYLGIAKDGGFVKKGEYIIYKLEELISIREITEKKFHEIMNRIAEGGI